MRKMGMTDKEISELLEYDKRVDHGADDYKLTPKQEKASKDARKKMGGSHRPPIYKLDNTGGKRSHKENPTKATIIADLAEFLKSIGENVEIANKERMICFECDGNKYDLTLVQKRKPKN